MNRIAVKEGRPEHSGFACRNSNPSICSIRFSFGSAFSQSKAHQVSHLLNIYCLHTPPKATQRWSEAHRRGAAMEKVMAMLHNSRSYFRTGWWRLKKAFHHRP